MFQITAFRVVAGAEHLVIASPQASPIIDDVERVVWFMLSGEPMVAADNDPQAKLLCSEHDLAQALGESIPVDLTR